MNVEIVGLPNYVHNHRFASISKKGLDGEYSNETVPAENINDAEVVTSQRNGLGNWHRPILDIDMAAHLIPSSTPGHFHLYIDKVMPWKDYEKLLLVLAEVGIIEYGYAQASIDRQYTAVRLPWIRK